MPKARKSRAGVKRSKTYVGCWTCRSRRVKCDAVRPTCNRCARGNHFCEGYGIRLVWDRREGEAQNPKGKGRLLFPEADRQNPAFNSDSEIDCALEQLDSVEVGFGFELGPYTVFRANFQEGNTGDSLDSDDSQILSHDDGSLVWTPRSEYVSENASTTHNEDEDIEGTQSSIFKASDFGNFSTQSCQSQVSKGVEVSSPGSELQQQLLPLLQPFLGNSSASERRLLHFWITSASGLMISTGHPDNPYRNVLIPLALATAGSGQKLKGNAALLHSMYAFAAFNIARIDQPERYESHHALAIKHHQASFRHLRQSVVGNDPSQNVAILAAIIVIIATDILNGQSSQWRIHLRGGRDWLRSLGDVWNDTQGGHVLYQMFQCFEVVGYFQNHGLRDFSGVHTLTEHTGQIDSVCSAISDNQGDDYYLDIFFGVTKPVLKAILEIKKLTSRGHSATPEELIGLESDIMLANPVTLRFPSLSKSLEKLTRHHACSWYYACVIYYRRSLHRERPKEIQHLVEQALYHLEAMCTFKEDSNSGCLLWPMFTVACEAEDDDLRSRSLERLNNREKYGIAATSSIRHVVLETWRRRDSSDSDVDIYGIDVAEDLGIDILLA